MSYYSFITDWLNQIGYNLPGFANGFIAGLFTILFIYIVLKLIIFFIRGKVKKCSGVISNSKTGHLHISSAAISDLVKSVGSQYTGLVIRKSKLYKKGKKFKIRILAYLNSSEVNFGDVVEDFRSEVINSLKTNLGVECINNVDIDLKRIVNS